jgi:peptidoglycan/LPS O-acetylase OafA/YrhL
MAKLTTPINRLHFLDSLRGIAALIVVFHHFMVFNGNALRSKVSAPFMNVLYFISDLNVEAVLFFFVISGFSIGLAQRGELLKSRSAANIYFYKRFKRILPIYLIALGLAALVGLFINSLQKESYSLANLLGNLLFLQTAAGATDYWFSPYGQNGPLWSLAYEMFFYIFFPIFSVLLLKTKSFENKIIAFCFLICCTLASIVVNKSFVFIPLFAFLSFFIVWWMGFEIAVEYLNRAPDFIFWGLLLGTCCILLLLQHRIPSATIIEIIKSLLIGSFLYLTLFLNLQWSSKVKNGLKAMINKVFKSLGHGSYALYALHYPIFILMNHLGVRWTYQIIFIFVLVICCIFLEKALTRQKFSIFALNYMLVNQKKLG